MSDQQYRCSSCGKSFSNASELHEHEKTCKSGSR